jgi:hypothetical protein
VTAGAIAAVAFSGAAQASVITETFTGIINSGIDDAGASGTAGASLTGSTVTFSFSYDAGLLEADAIVHFTPLSDSYDDYAGDSAVTESVTLDTIANNSIYADDGGQLEGCIAAICGGADGLFYSFAQDD